MVTPRWIARRMYRTLDFLFHLLVLISQTSILLSTFLWTDEPILARPTCKLRNLVCPKAPAMHYLRQRDI
jgi:hypothetical protein